MQITIYGSGSWGTALACLLHDNGHKVNMWGWLSEQVNEIIQLGENPLLPGISIPEDMEITTDYSIGSSSDLIVFAVPSGAVKKVTSAATPFIKKDALLVNVAKGFHPDTQQRLSEIIKEAFPGRPVMTLSGPSHAEEVARKLPTAIAISGDNPQMLHQVQDIFMNQYFRVYPNEDQIGAEVGGAVKNIIALGSGIIDGLGLGDNSRAAIMTRGLAEMKRLGVAMGAQPRTFSGLTGMGDLIVTCTSIHSRNYRAGKQIGQGKPWKQVLAETNMVVEGVYATEATYKLAQKYGIEMPITEQIHKILYENITPQEAMISLLTREKTKSE